MQYVEINPYGNKLYVPEGHFPTRKTKVIDTGYGYATEISHGNWRLIDPDTGELRLPPVRGAATAAAYTCTPAPFAAGTAIHTFITAISPAGHGLSCTEFAVSFDGVTATAVPVLVTLNQSTQATAGTAGGSTVITQVRGRLTSGSAPTMGSAYTAQNTVLTIVKSWYVPAFMGQYTYQAPLGREVECDSSGGTIKALSIVTTPAAAVNVTGYMEVEALG